MDPEVPIFTNDHYGNSFSKLVIGCGLIWLGFVAYNQTVNPSNEKQYNNGARHHLKAGSKINKMIQMKNNQIKLPPKIHIFNRNKRFNRYF